MRGHLALAVMVCLAACTRTLTSADQRACPPPQDAQRGVGIIGMSIDQQRAANGEAVLFVDRIVPDGPAARAGIRAGDRLVTIEGAATHGMSIAEAARRLRGPVDVAVGLEVANTGRTRRVSITRVAPSELWNGDPATPAVAGDNTTGVHASDVAPAAPLAVPPCRR